MVDVADELRKVKAIQEQRVQCYQQFESAFQAFLSDRHAATYRATLVQLTGEFGALASDMRQAMTALAAASPPVPLVVRCVADMQAAEETKLHLTVKSQILRQMLPSQHPQHPQQPQQPQQPAPGHRCAHQHHQHHHQGEGREGEGAEEQEARVKADLAGVRRELGEVDGQLRECLDTVQCELADMLG